MITAIGKLLRNQRMNRGELLKDMAEKLNISSAYLSAIENGKRNPTDDFINNIKEVYNLNTNEYQELEDAYFKTIKEVHLSLKNTNDKQNDLSLSFARRVNNLDNDQIEYILKILNNKELK